MESKWRASCILVRPTRPRTGAGRTSCTKSWRNWTYCASSDQVLNQSLPKKPRPQRALKKVLRRRLRMPTSPLNRAARVHQATKARVHRVPRTQEASHPHRPRWKPVSHQKKQIVTAAAAQISRVISKMFNLRNNSHSSSQRLQPVDRHKTRFQEEVNSILPQSLIAMATAVV